MSAVGPLLSTGARDQSITSLQLCDECLQELEQHRLRWLKHAERNTVINFQWCGHRRVHALLFRGALTFRRCATTREAELLNRAYESSVTQLCAMEFALTAVLRGEATTQ